MSTPPTPPTIDPSIEAAKKAKKKEKKAKAKAAATEKAAKAKKRKSMIITGVLVLLGVIALLFVANAGHRFYVSNFAQSTSATVEDGTAKALAAVEKTTAEAQKVIAEAKAAKAEAEAAKQELLLKEAVAKAEAEAAEKAAEQKRLAEASERNAKMAQDRAEAAEAALLEVRKKAEDEKAEAAKVAAEALQKKEVSERTSRQMEIVTSTKNFNAEGTFEASDEDALKKALMGWIEQNGYYFPLIENDNGNPSPVKGDDEPYPLAPRGTKWIKHEVTLENPRGSGSYTTVGWATKTRPNIKK